MAALVSAIPGLHRYTIELCLGILAFVTLLNLRGTLDAGRLFAVPTYTFVSCFLLLLAIGCGDAPPGGSEPTDFAVPAPVGEQADSSVEIPSYPPDSGTPSTPIIPVVPIEQDAGSEPDASSAPPDEVIPAAPDAGAPGLPNLLGDGGLGSLFPPSTPPAPSADGTPPFICGQSLGPGRIRFGGYPLSLFANGLSQIVGRMVVDRTGLDGRFDFTLEWTPPLPPPGVDGGAPVTETGPSIFTALQEQLGLKLESQRGPVRVLVIDRLERPTPN